MAGYNILLDKLDSFIRKYYKNMLLRGLLFLTTISTGFYLFLIFSEYFFFFGTKVRMVLFFTYLFIAIYLLIQFIVIPLLKLYKLGKILSYEQAAVIVGMHFSEVQDKLLNTLQLLKEDENRESDNELLSASIDQKTQRLRVLHFNAAINYRANYRYFKFAGPPLIVLFFLLIFAPQIISEPTQRIIQFQREFKRPLGFDLEILNRNLKALQNDDFELKIRFEGVSVPNEAFLLTDGVSYKMVHKGSGEYHFIFKVLQNDVHFKIQAGVFTSDEFHLKVYPKPVILNFDIRLVYPPYIKKPDEFISNTGDIIIPEGTNVSWIFKTKDVTRIGFGLQGNEFQSLRSSDQLYKFSTGIYESKFYYITPVNEYTYHFDTLKYQIIAVKDRFPSISSKFSGDTNFIKDLVYEIEINDDYGFTSLTFVYELFAVGDSIALSQDKIDLIIGKNVNRELVYFNKDLSEFLNTPGQRLKYYFEVLDNDGVHGPKRARTPDMYIKAPTLDEQFKKEISMAEVIKSSMDRSREDAEETAKSIDAFKMRLMDQDALKWEERKRVEDIVRKAERIINDVDKVSRDHKQQMGTEQQVRISERLIEKQKELNSILENLYTEEMKRMVEEIKKLMNNIEKEKLSKLMEKMQLSMEDLEKELDRDLALMKKLEFEKNLEFVVKELRSLANEQRGQAEEAKKELVTNQELGKGQEELSQKFDSIRKNIEDLKEQGLQLENPVELKESDAMGDSIKKLQEKSAKGLKKGERKNSIQNQREAGDLMEKLASNLEESQSESEEEELAEDADNIRMILENLLRLSFNQEELMRETRNISRNDPRYPLLIKRQAEIRLQVDVVKDSLESISRRQVFIQPIVKKELITVTENIGLSIDEINKRNIGSAVTRQQVCMTALNNLANLLSESLDRMNNQMQMNMQAKGGLKSCSKPTSKGGKRSMKSMREMQSEINRQLEGLKKGLDASKGKGKTPNKDGDKQLNEQIARMAAQQEALRNAMARQMEESSGMGLKENENLNRILKSMDESERDILNKRVTAETLRRQQEIVSRMLESEKAEQKREYDNHRTSIEAKMVKSGNLNEISKYNKSLTGSTEFLKYREAPVNGFYKAKAHGYVLKISQ